MHVLLRCSISSLLLGTPVALSAPAFPRDPALQAVPFFSGASFPTACAVLPLSPGVPQQLFVLEKATGRVLWLRGGLLQGVVLDLAVNSSGERGLLGIALHPQFGINGFVFLYYSASSTAGDETSPAAVLGNRVERFTWNAASLGSPTLILQLPFDPSVTFHQGGTIRFGPDGMLYGVTGDLGRFGKLQNVRQGPEPDDTSIVFRIRDDGTAPDDNPFFALGGMMQKVFAFGLRNSFGLDFDPVTGVLWDTENGPAHYDEVNSVAPGFNSGWASIMGPDERDPQGIADLWSPSSAAAYSDPEFSWLAPVASTAIHFVRPAHAGLQSDCLVGSFTTRSIYRFELDASRAAFIMPNPALADRVADTNSERDEFLWATGFDGGVVDIEAGPDGVLYVVAFESGTVYRIANPTAVLDIGTKPRLSLIAYPNPFANALRLHRSDLDPLRVLTIYAVDGRCVRTLESDGPEVLWDGRDGSGARVGAGAYFARSPGCPALVIHRIPRR